MPKLIIPKSLTRYTDGISILDLKFAQINQFIASIKLEYPNLYQILFKDDQLNKYICLYLNSQLFRELTDPAPVNEEDTLEIILAVSGG